MSFRRPTSPVGAMSFDMDKALAAQRLGVPYNSVDDDFMAGVLAVSEKIAQFTDGVYFKAQKPWVRAYTIKGRFASFKWPRQATPMLLDVFIMQRLAFDRHGADPLSNPKFREGVMAKLAYLSCPSSVLDDADGKIFTLETRRKAVRQLEERRRKAATLEALQRASQAACGHIDRSVCALEGRHPLLARSGLPRAAGFVAKIGVHLVCGS